MPAEKSDATVAVLPMKDPTKKPHQVVLHLDEEVYKELKGRADYDLITCAAYLRRLIAADLRKKRRIA